jgi:hypothetical protein
MEKNNMSGWYEVRVDGEKVAAFAPISRDGCDKAFQLVADTRLGLYKEKQMQIVACYEDSQDGNRLPRRRCKVIHEENPTVIEDEPEGGWPKVAAPPIGCVEPLPYELFVM